MMNLLVPVMAQARVLTFAFFANSWTRAGSFAMVTGISWWIVAVNFWAELSTGALALQRLLAWIMWPHGAEINRLAVRT